MKQKLLVSTYCMANSSKQTFMHSLNPTVSDPYEVITIVFIFTGNGGTEK